MAQTVPANPLVPKGSVKSSTRNVGGGSSGGLEAGLSSKTREKETIVINYNAVSALREWTNLEGKKIKARLLAYSIPKPGKTGAVEVLREGKVLFLIPGQTKPIQYPKDQLEDDDQIEIERIVEAASYSVTPTKEEMEKMEKEKKAE
jgi:hypothetical protein